MTESDTPTGDGAQAWLDNRRINGQEGFTPRHKSAEVVAAALLPAVNFVRDEATIVSNVPRLPQILKEQLRRPHQRWVFAGLVVIRAVHTGVATWIIFGSPIPGVILGSYLGFRRTIERSVFE